MMLVLDTHAWVWWCVSSRKLPAYAKRRIERAGEVCIASMSVLEVTYAHRTGKLQLNEPIDDWLRLALREIAVVPMDEQIAHVAGKLDYPHGDPADRVIIATAQHLHAKLVTNDQRIHSHQPVDVIWKR